MGFTITLRFGQSHESVAGGVSAPNLLHQAKLDQFPKVLSRNGPCDAELGLALSAGQLPTLQEPQHHPPLPFIQLRLHGWRHLEPAIRHSKALDIVARALESYLEVTCVGAEDRRANP